MLIIIVVPVFGNFREIIHQSVQNARLPGTFHENSSQFFRRVLRYERTVKLPHFRPQPDVFIIGLKSREIVSRTEPPEAPFAHSHFRHRIDRIDNAENIRIHGSRG